MPASAGGFEVMLQEFVRPNPQQCKEYSRLRSLVELPDHGDEAIRVARDLLKTILDTPRPSAHLTDQLADAVTIDSLTLFLVERDVALADGDEEPFLRTKRVKHGGRLKAGKASATSRLVASSRCLPAAGYPEVSRLRRRAENDRGRPSR